MIIGFWDGVAEIQVMGPVVGRVGGYVIIYAMDGDAMGVELAMGARSVYVIVFHQFLVKNKLKEG